MTFFLFGIPLWAAAIIWGINGLCSPSTKKCPHCAEDIKREANVCRYCGRDVAGGRAPVPDTISNAAAFWWAFGIGAVFLILVILGVTHS